ncbi:hypothetical protein ACFIOY_29690 [Bradyrhizobium sp. TZ2]
MRKTAFLPCIPTGGERVPSHPDWLHEIKHDGYRLILQRDGKRVRLWTRNGYDWSNRFPAITEAALRSKRPACGRRRSSIAGGRWHLGFCQTSQPAVRSGSAVLSAPLYL